MGIRRHILLNNFAEFFKKIGLSWQKTNRSQKIIVIAVIVLTIILIGVVVTVSGQTTYTVLYSGLSAADSGAIYQALQEMQVDVQAPTSGTIMVPADQAESIRNQLFARGLPASAMGGAAGGINYGDFYIENGMAFNATDSDKQMISKFQMQYNLSQMINQSEKVESSTVLLNIAPTTQFALDTNESSSSATVMVRLKPGATFTDEDAIAIKKMVAASVPDLKEEDVVVTDQSLRVFGGNGMQSSGTGAVANQMQIEQEASARLSNQLMSLFAPVFGAENIAPSVHLKLDFDNRTTESITLEPPTEVGADENRGIATSMKSMVEHIANGDTAQGQPGLDTNGGAPTYQEVVDNINNTDYYKVTEEFNFEVNEVKELIEAAQGGIVEASATIMINGGDEVQAAIEDVRTAASTAIGIPAENITVLAMPFAENTTLQQQLDDQAAAVAELQRNQMIKTIVPYVVVAGVIILIALLLLNAFKKKKEMELEAQRLQWMQEQAEREAMMRQSGMVDVVAGEDIDLDSIMEEEKNSTLGQLQALVQKNPDGIAQILRNWLMDDYRR